MTPALQGIKPKLELMSPFPPAALEAAWRWHKYTQTCINGRDYTRNEFMTLMHEALTCPETLSWVLTLEGVPVGIVLFTPIWRGQHRTDGSIHICLARQAWGKRELPALVTEMIRQGFAQVPTLTRMTAFTPNLYRPSHKLLEEQGFQKEGVMRDGARVRGRVLDIAVFGLTRQDWEDLENGKSIRGS